MTALAWLLVAVPLGVGTLLLLTGRRGDGAAPVLGVVIGTVTLGLALAAAALHPVTGGRLFAGIPFGLAVDGLSALLIIAVAATTLAVLVFSAGDISREESRARFFGLMLLFAGAMLVTVTSTSLALLLMAWEVMGAASWALIGFWWREPRRVRAANTAFLTTRSADLGLYVAAGAALAGGVSTLTLAQLDRAQTPWLTVVTAGVVLAALGKSAQLPFSFWLSQAMEGPSPVSALLHSATMVAAGAYLLLRLQPLLVASGWGEPTVAWLGALTALVLGLVAVAQRDLKQLLAASTSAQVGFMVLAAGSGAVSAGVMQLLAHAATKSLLFLAAGAWLTALGTKQLPALRGAALRYPLVGVTFSAGAITLAGLPPGSLWVTKDAVLAATLARSLPLYAVGLAAAIVSAVYSAKALWFVWRPELPDAESVYDTERAGTRRVVAAMTAPLLVLAMPALTLGVLGIPPLAEAFNRSLGEQHGPGLSWSALLLSAVLALLAAGLTWWWGDRGLPMPAPAKAALANWIGLERLAHATVVRPTLALAKALALFDDHVLDRAVLGVATGGLAVARLVDARAESSIDGLVSDLVAAARRLGALARRPQTGQLHQYYAQAVVVLLLLALAFALLR